MEYGKLPERIPANQDDEDETFPSGPDQVQHRSQ